MGKRHVIIDMRKNTSSMSLDAIHEGLIRDSVVPIKGTVLVTEVDGGIKVSDVVTGSVALATCTGRADPLLLLYAIRSLACGGIPQLNGTIEQLKEANPMLGDPSGAKPASVEIAERILTFCTRVEDECFKFDDDLRSILHKHGAIE